MTSLQHNVGRVVFAIGMVLSIVALGQAVGLESPWFGVVASFSLLGLMDLTMPMIRFRLPSSLRALRAWEIRGDAYRRLGVQAFGMFLRRTPARLLNRRVYLELQGRDLALVHAYIEDAEAAHFWGCLATVPYLAFTWFRGWSSAVVAVALFDVFVNIYPILHLRSVRGRIERALRRGLIPCS